MNWQWKPYQVAYRIDLMDLYSDNDVHSALIVIIEVSTGLRNTGLAYRKNCNQAKIRVVTNLNIVKSKF